MIDALPAIEWVPPNQLTLLPGNPRKGDIDAIARSIQEFGFIVPVVANSEGTVVAGNHRLQAARQLELDKIPVQTTKPPCGITTGKPHDFTSDP